MLCARCSVCEIVDRYWKDDIPCGLDCGRVTEKQWYALGDDSTATAMTAGGSGSLCTTAGLLEDGSGSGGIRRRGRRQARWEKRNSKVKNTEGGQGKGQGLQEHSGVRGGGVRKAGRGTGAGTSHRSGAMSGVPTVEDAEREANRKAVAAWAVQVRRKSVAQHQRATAGSNEGSRAAGPASFDEIFYGVLGKMLMRNQMEARQRGDTAGNQPLPQPLPSAGVRTQWNLPPLTGERQNRP
jgi:hypothetical protein